MRKQWACAAGVLGLVCLSLACGDSSTSDPEKIVIEKLSARVGPSGGTLEGAAGSAYAGFRLVIPPGALDQEVEITVSGVVDPTPLAATAERVGPQFAIEPAGLALKVPASLTVPFDDALRQAWDTPDSECRVWYRDGDKWSNAVQTASTPTGVTVELPKLAVAAAGVFVFSKVTSCKLLGTCPPTIGDQGCLVGQTFCLTRLVPPKVAAYEYNSVSVENGYAYFLTSPGQNQFAIAKYDLSSTNGATTTTVALTGTPTRSVAAKGRITVDANGELWLGLLGYGNVRFRPSASATRFDTSTSGQGPNGAIFFDDTLYRLILKNTAKGRELQLFRSSSNSLDRSVALDANATVEARVIRKVTGTTSYSGPFGLASTVEGLSPLELSTKAGFQDVCGTRSPLLSTFEITSRHRAVGCQGFTVHTTFASTLVEPGHAISSLAIDNQKNTFVVDASIPQITRIDSIGGVSSIALSSAAAGSAEANRMLPRAIRYEPGLDMLVLFTRGNNAGGAPDIFLIENFRD